LIFPEANIPLFSQNELPYHSKSDFPLKELVFHVVDVIFMCCFFC